MKNKKYPTVVIDNFFKNPELIREFALSLPFEKSPDGRWPGERSPMLNEIDEELVKNIAAKILSIYFDLKTRVYWDDIQMTFQKTRQYSNEKDSPQNKGWIHIDEDKSFAGVIYLFNTVFYNPCWFGSILHQDKSVKLAKIIFRAQCS